MTLAVEEQKVPATGVKAPGRGVARSPAPEGEGAAGVSVASLPPVSSTPPEQRVLLQIMEHLASAKEKIRTAVKKAIDKAELESDEGARVELKKKAERKREEVLAKVAELEARVRSFSHCGRVTLGRINQKIDVLLQASKKLSQLEGVAEEVDYAGLEAAMDRIVAEVDTAILETEKIIKQDDLMQAMFGANWDMHVRLGALDDGVIRPSEFMIGRSPSEGSWFNKLGAIAQDGLTRPEIEQIVRARRCFSALFGALRVNDGGEPENEPNDVRQAFDELIELAARGELTQEAMNNILDPFGIKFNAESFSYLFTGKSDEWFTEEKAIGVDEFTRRILNLARTMQLMTGINLEDEWDRMGEMDSRSKDAITQQLRRYSQGTRFYDIKFETAKKCIEKAIGGGSGLTIPQMIAQLSTSLRGSLKREIDRINDRELADDKKWEQIVLALYQEIMQGPYIRVDEGIEDPEKQAKEREKRFEDMIVAVQTSTGGYENGVAEAAFVGELRAIFIGKKQNFDVDAVLNPKPDSAMLAQEAEGLLKAPVEGGS